jgi:hypothetical protein
MMQDDLLLAFDDAKRRSRMALTQRVAVVAVIVVTALVVLSFVARAAVGAGVLPDVALGNTEYDGRFVFVRLSYEMSLRIGDGDVPWAHDYPDAERNLTKILSDVTRLNPFQGPNGGNVLPLDDSELHKFPFAYMSEPGYWVQTDAEAESLRNYLLKGGFLVFDDFRGEHWDNFEVQIGRVLPEARLVALDIAHPVFHSFFDIKTLEMDDWMYGLPPRFYGVFEDNDPNERLMLVANYNNDIGEYWEYAETGWLPIDLTNEAYQFGVNYVMYAMTH